MGHVTLIGSLIVAVMIYVIIAMVSEIYGEDEQPRERGESFEWVAYDRRLDVVSAQILRRYRCRLHRLFFIVRSRAPPLTMNDPDGLAQASGHYAVGRDGIRIRFSLKPKQSIVNS